MSLTGQAEHEETGGVHADVARGLQIAMKEVRGGLLVWLSTETSADSIP
jgi:hypothetical protein